MDQHNNATCRENKVKFEVRNDRGHKVQALSLQRILFNLAMSENGTRHAENNEWVKLKANDNGEAFLSR